MADLLPVTGILLLGGASERFGSPKAQANFRGETLAERAWRVLNDACEEVLAVGKADGADLPFPVLDDGVEEHAPIHGLIAGLRAASNDVCLALPVDCPLVTPDTLRALAATRTVPQTGPLPGAYHKDVLAELEERVARGELSLRGVNPLVLDVDETLLLNVNTPVDLFLATVADWAGERDDVHAVFLIGSLAQGGSSHDRLADIDLTVFVDDPARLIDDAEWLAALGTPVLTILRERVVRRVLFDDGQMLDLIAFDAGAWKQVLASPEARIVLARGYRLLYDQLGVADELEARPPDVPIPPPDASAFESVASDFWYHAISTARKLRRGDVFVAIECLDGHMKSRLVTLLAWHARALDPSTDASFAGRHLERWADPGALAALERAYAHYDVRDVARALWETIDLFQGVEEETARRLGLTIELDHADLRRRVAAAVPDTRLGGLR